MDRATQGELPSEQFQADVTCRGRELYDRLRHMLEAEFPNQYLAVHVDSGDFEVADSTSQAARKLRKRHVADGRIYMRRIGDEPEMGLAARMLAADQVVASRK